MILIGAGWLFGTLSEGTATPAASDTDCAADLACWGNRNNLRGNAICKATVEARAGVRLRWDDVVVPFDRFDWHRQADASLTYISQHAQLLTEAAGWTPAVIRCAFDPRTGAVEQVTAVPR